MLTRLHIPKTLLWVIHLLVIYTLLFTIFRTITVIAFKPETEHFSDLVPSFILGLRFDLRWIAIVLLPLAVAGSIPRLSPFFSARNKKIWTWYLAIMTFIILFFFAADFGAFTYNKTRLGASALNFAEDPSISMMMLWQSYPIIWMVAGLTFAVVMLRKMFQKMHSVVIKKVGNIESKHKRNLFLAMILSLGFIVYGGFPQSLQWNAAFKLGDSFRSYLALNPLQNFFATLKLRKTEFDEEKAKKYFPVIADWMNWHDGNTYTRIVNPSEPFINTKPNVVLVMCESFSMYKSSMSGNPLNTTPYFKSMCDQGVFFDHCFTPHFSTARGLFATITGIPDVQLSKFSTRNPDALKQHTIINDFKDYSKFYFLGGDPSFNNFEGLVGNINGVNMITEGRFRSQSVNVWGISDKDLFAEANKTFAQQTKPFFAIVQTADNHRPFTIPEKDTVDFKIENPDGEQLKKYGFESAEEYNAFRYFDYCVKNFIEAAKKEKYFDNTIFVFFGDHGVSGNAAAIYPSVWTEERLTEEHVPLLFYSPKLLSPEKKQQVVSQIDILPSIAGLTGQAYTNTTLGRDVFHNASDNHSAFIILHDEGRIGVVTDDYYFTKNLNFDNEELHSVRSTTFTQKQLDSVKQKLSTLTTAYYETARWMLVHNRPPSDFPR